MSWLSSRAAQLGAAAFFCLVAAVGGCSSSESTGTEASTFCGASRAAVSSCASSTTDCDTTLTNQCGKLDAVLNRTLLESSRDCLESGICGASSCLTRGQSTMRALTAHTTLANDYCSSCAPGNTGCAAQFYARRGNAPGAVVLPYSESVAAAVDQACTRSTDCAATFATCAADTIATTVAQGLSADVASCTAAAFQRDGEDPGNSPDGGPTAALCTAANCDGCCRNDVCEKGDTVEGCGVGAVACATCSGAQSCTAGACREPCGPDNCPGCCSADGVCLDGTADATCGQAGEACAKCSDKGSSYRCSDQQQCVDTSCAATCLTGCCDTTGCRPGTAASGCGNGGKACVNCGAGNACNPTSRTCFLDPDSTWDVVIVSASLPDTNMSGGSWDSFSGLPDPYVIVYSGGSTAQTPVLNDTTSPTWNATTLKGIKASQLKSSFSFNVWDSDYGFGVDPDDSMGGCTIAIGDADFGNKLRSKTCAATASQKQLSIIFKIVKS